MRAWAVACGLLCLTTSNGLAQTEDQSKALRSAAYATMLADRCPLWIVNVTSLNILLAIHDIAAADVGVGGKYDAAITTMMSEFDVEAANLEAEYACLAAELLYGPRGTDRPNLMRRR